MAACCLCGARPTRRSIARRSTGIVRDPSEAVIAEGARSTSPAWRPARLIDGDDDQRRHLPRGEPGAGRVPGAGRSARASSASNRPSPSSSARARASTCRWRSARSARRSRSRASRRCSAPNPRCSAPSSTATRWTKLPLAIRNWDDLLSMVPGVQSDRYTEQAGGTSAGRTGGVSVHGNRSLQNNFLLDGVANNSFSTNVQELTTQLSRPSVDAIDEFKVVTSPYAAEYGWSPGAAIIVSTKSGTNAHPRHRLRLFPQRLARLDQLLRQARQPAEADQQAEPVRRQPRRPADAQPRVLLRRLRGHPHRAGRAAHRQRA